MQNIKQFPLTIIMENKKNVVKNALVPLKKDGKGRVYRLHCRHFGLTYSDCPLLKEEIMKLLKGKLVAESRKRRKKIYWKYVRVANELHQNGNLHCHVLIILNKKTEFNDAREFFKLPFVDKYGNSTFYFPGFQRKLVENNPMHLFQYIGAYGDYIEDGIPPKIKVNYKKQRSDFISFLDKKLLELQKPYLQSEITREEAINSFEQSLKEIRTKDCTFYWDNQTLFERMIKKIFPILPVDNEIKYPLDSYLPEIIELVLPVFQKELAKKDRLKTIFGVGGTQIGKTRFFKAVCRHFNLPFNYMKTFIDFSEKNYDDSKPVLIIDDVDLNSFYKDGFLKRLIGNGDDFLVNVKYGEIRKIKPPKLVIFIVNPNHCPLEWCDKNEKYYSYDCIYFRQNIEVINFDIEKYSKERPLFYTDDEKEFKQKLSKLNGRGIEELANFIFGKENVEVKE